MDVAERNVERFSSLVRAWAEADQDIEAVALVGSWARGTARPGSDVDLILIAGDPGRYLNDDAWLRRFGALRSVADEDWGVVQSRRAFYEDGLEAEFGLTTARWAAIHPFDAGTARVDRDGMRVLFDRSGDLGRLVARVR